MRIEIYVQARMGSTRLSGKVMMPILGKPLLEFLIERLKQVKEADAIAILTTTQPADDVIVMYCQKVGILCYRGPEDDVLGRYYQVAAERKPDAVVRITADCPLIDPDVVDLAISTFRQCYPAVDYVSNCLEHTFPRGLDVEVFSYQALEEAYFKARKTSEREHVTSYINSRPEHFKLKNIAGSQNLSHYRLTVDTIEDFTLIRLIFENLWPNHRNFRLNDILALMKKNPEWFQINSHIKQKLL